MNTSRFRRWDKLRAGLPVLSLFGLLALTLGSNGCATENKVLKTPRYTLSYPDFWKVEKVGEKDGEATRVTIGKYSASIITEGSGAVDAMETSQADVDVRIYAWPASAPIDEPTNKVSELLAADPDLNLSKQSAFAPGSRQCGQDFRIKMKLLNTEQYPLDLFSRPGHRLILIGAVNSGVLVGVVSRVPYEQDAGLYCHNLQNMRVQMQNLLDGIALAPTPPPPPQVSPPAAAPPSSPPSGAASSPPAAPAAP